MGMAARRGYLFALIVSAVMGLLWMLLNAGSVPAYGDSREYLHAAQTLKVDQYRTIFYPFLLRILGVVSGGTTRPFTLGIYTLQWSALCLSTALFVYAAVRALSLRWTRRRTIQVVAGATLVVATNPLIAHFSMALMSDSLASSLTIAAIASVSLALGGKSVPNWKWLLFAALLLFLMGLSRVDKLYTAATICVMTLLWVAWTRRGHDPASRSKTAAVGALLLVTLTTVVVVNRATQIYNPHRPPLNASSLAFNRVVWPHLTETYPYLSPRVKAVISRREAAHFDEHNNNVYPLLTRLLMSDPRNRAIIDETTLTTLRHFPGQVVGKTAFDLGKYTLPNIAFPLELVHVLPLSVASDWTRSRMEQTTPRLTDAALWISQATFLFGGLPVALAMLFRVGRPRTAWPPISWLVATVIAANSLLFGLEAGMDAHIRYALPTYTLWQALVAAISLSWILALPRQGERTPADGCERTAAFPRPRDG